MVGPLVSPNGSVESLVFYYILDWQLFDLGQVSLFNSPNKAKSLAIFPSSTSVRKLRARFRRR
jgi:hypothetical protein